MLRVHSAFFFFFFEDGVLGWLLRRLK